MGAQHQGVASWLACCVQCRRKGLNCGNRRLVGTSRGSRTFLLIPDDPECNFQQFTA
jgi:hypothetical protein